MSSECDDPSRHRVQVFASLRQYARLGWKVFPVHYAYPPPGDDHAALICTCGDLSCRNVGKHPAYAGYADAATSNLRDLEWTWFDRRDQRRRNEPWNIGLLTGEPSGVWVLDIDNKEDEGGANGSAALDALVQANGPLPATVMAQSGSRRPGTRHYFWRYDARIRSDIGGIAPGIDVLAGGKRLVVLPPSRHKSGQTYLFFNGHTPSQIEVSAAPEWLIQEIIRKQERDAVACTKQSRPRPAWIEDDARSVIFNNAVLAYNLANTPEEWPRGRRGACPVCGSPDGFIVLHDGDSGSAAWWNCKSTRHHDTRCGRRSPLDGSWGGTALDVDVYNAGLGLRQYLIDVGYLE
jgi:hypothetical protein